MLEVTKTTLLDWTGDWNIPAEDLLVLEKRLPNNRVAVKLLWTNDKDPFSTGYMGMSAKELVLRSRHDQRTGPYMGEDYADPLGYYKDNRTITESKTVKDLLPADVDLNKFKATSKWSSYTFDIRRGYEIFDFDEWSNEVVMLGMCDIAVHDYDADYTFEQAKDLTKSQSVV